MGSESTTKPRRKSRRAKARAASLFKRSKPLSRREKTAQSEERAELVKKWAPALTTSLIVNGLIVILLAFIVLAEPASPPPSFSVLPPNPDKDEDISTKVVDYKRKQHSTSSAASFTPIVAPSVSPVVFAPPQFDTASVADFSGAMVGLDTGLGYGASGAGTGGATESGTIGGMRVRSQRLGVVLDVSGSMSEQIKAVRRELRQSFTRATIVEVSGCRLDYDGEVPQFELSKSKIELEKEAKSVNEAIEMLIVKHRADAIYWFSDLNDQHTKDGTDRLSHLLGVFFGSDRRPIKFYVHSVDRNPSEKLEGIAKRSGGATKVKAYEEE